VAGTVLHRRLGVAAQRFEAFLHAVESLATFITGWYCSHERKVYLPYVMLVPAPVSGVLASAMIRTSGRTKP
jgi:hypothetical protein